VPHGAITFERLRAALESKFDCECESFPDGAVRNTDGSTSWPLYGFWRVVNGRPELSTIVVHHPKLPLDQEHVRSFLARLHLTLDEVFG
jgi:hypothetical protein